MRRMAADATTVNYSASDKVSAAVAERLAHAWFSKGNVGDSARAEPSAPRQKARHPHGSVEVPGLRTARFGALPTR